MSARRALAASAFARALAAAAASDERLEDPDVCEVRCVVPRGDDLSVMTDVVPCCLDSTVVVVSMIAGAVT